MLDWMIKVPCIQRGYRICDKYGKSTAKLSKTSVYETVVSSSPEYDIHEKEDLNSFKIIFLFSLRHKSAALELADNMTATKS
jgi:hypothetical protein